MPGPLCQHPDFEQAILMAAEHFASTGLRPALIEKDYYITEALRAVATAGGDSVIFKGRTSLSKGWNLIQRFSEDVDLFLDPLAFKPTLGRRGIDRELKRLRDAVAGVAGMTFLAAESQTIGGFGRCDRFAYRQRFGEPGEVADRVLMETGSASGREPTAVVPLRSWIGQFFAETGQTLSASDESAFPMRLLHFRRTFVEKLFAIHGKVQLMAGLGHPLGSYARHYYDLYQLAGTDEVRQMLRSPEYASIRDDYDRISRAHFARDYSPPDGLSFATSDALFPTGALADTIAVEYERQCRILCFGPFPTWSQAQERLNQLRSLL